MQLYSMQKCIFQQKSYWFAPGAQRHLRVPGVTEGRGSVFNECYSGSSTSLRYTKQLNLNGYIGAKIKGRVLQIMGNLPIELAMLATKRVQTEPNQWDS